MNTRPCRARAVRARRIPAGRAGFAIAVALLAHAAVVARASDALRLEAIALEPSGGTISLLPGETQAIRAIATYSDDSTRDLTEQMVYKSSNPAVVAIVGPALAQAISSGGAEISAVDPISGKSARSKVRFKVAKLAVITLSPEAKNVRVGGTLALRALGRYDNGRSGIDVTSAVEWSSDKRAIATVGNDAGTKGVVLGIAPGLVKILARDPVSGIKSSNDTSRVTVVAELTEIVVTPSSRSLRIGASTRFKATGLFGDLPADVSADVEWSTSNASVATIDPTGKVTAIAPGAATVSARDVDTGITSTASASDAVVTVVSDLVALAVSPAAATLRIGESLPLVALATFQGATRPVKLTSGVRWTSSSPAVLTIDPAKGLATCVAMGTSTASVTDKLTSLSSTVFGGDAAIGCADDQPAIRVAPSKPLLAVGKTRQMQAYWVFADGTESSATSAVVWSSSDPRIVSVVATGAGAGKATALKPGVATVVATDPASGHSSEDDGGTSAKFSVAGEPETVEIFPKPSNRPNLSAVVGQPFQLKARLSFTGGATQGINALVDWEVSNPAMLHISDGTDGSPAGWATPLRPGRIIVTIAYPKASGPAPQFPPSSPLGDAVGIDIRAR